MVPIQKVKDIVSRYNILEKELSSGDTNPKLLAKIQDGTPHLDGSVFLQTSVLKLKKLDGLPS